MHGNVNGIKYSASLSRHQYSGKFCLKNSVYLGHQHSSLRYLLVTCTKDIALCTAMQVQANYKPPKLKVSTKWPQISTR